MDWAVTGATLLLVAVGSWQIAAIRKENRLERTIAACCRYESDQVIERCVHELREARRSRSFDDEPQKYEHSLIMVLNYLDTMAIGIHQGIYDESLAREHTESIIKHYAGAYLTEEVARAVGFRLNDYHWLCKLAKTWSIPESYFARRSWWRLT